MKKTILTGIFLYGSWLYSQQDPQFSFYNFNPEIYNAAYAGSREALNITLIGRKQWLNFPGSPSTGSLTLHTPLKDQRFNVGLNFLTDKTGARSTNSIYLDLAYRTNFTKSYKIAFGLKSGMDLYQADFRNLVSNDNGDSFKDQPYRGTLNPNFGFGVHINNKASYLSFGMPRLLNKTLDNKELSANIVHKHFFAAIGHSIDVGLGKKLLFTSLVKIANNAPISLDVNSSFMLHEKIMFGVGHRFGDSFNANIVYFFNEKFKAGYVYDHTITKLSNYHSGSHEIMLGYDLSYRGKGFYSPRIF